MRQSMILKMVDWRAMEYLSSTQVKSEELCDNHPKIMVIHDSDLRDRTNRNHTTLCISLLCKELLHLACDCHLLHSCSFL